MGGWGLYLLHRLDGGGPPQRRLFCGGTVCSVLPLGRGGCGPGLGGDVTAATGMCHRRWRPGGTTLIFDARVLQGSALEVFVVNKGRADGRPSGARPDSHRPGMRIVVLTRACGKGSTNSKLITHIRASEGGQVPFRPGWCGRCPPPSGWMLDGVPCVAEVQPHARKFFSGQGFFVSVKGKPCTQCAHSAKFCMSAIT